MQALAGFRSDIYIARTPHRNTVILYQILIRLLSPIIGLFIAFEAIKKQGKARFLKQRLGFSYPVLSSRPIWLHCASVGEVKSVEILVRKLLPTEPILITTSTTTSANLVIQLFADQVTHCYLPFDWPSSIQRFLTATQPKTLWVVETEIWPNLYEKTYQSQIPITIISARLSKKTLDAPLWLKKSYQTTLQYPVKILARSPQDAKNFIQLGADSNKVTVLGNIKYSQLENPSNHQPQTNRSYVLLASSHQDEEYQIAKLWLEIKPTEQLIIVPRHPQRIKNINERLLTLTDSIGVFSQGDDVKADFSIFVDDRIGFLIPWFSHAKIVIMGGSFIPKGGHNPLEPAALKKAIIMGADVANFKAEYDLLQENKACIQCTDYEDLKTTLISLLNDKNKCLEMGENAFKVIHSQSRIIDDYLKVLTNDLNLNPASACTHIAQALDSYS